MYSKDVQTSHVLGHRHARWLPLFVYRVWGNSRVVQLALPVAVFAFAIALRLVNLGNWPRAYVDEGLYAFAGPEYLNGQFGLWYRFPSFSAPAVMWGSGLSSALLGNDYFSVRLPGALLGAGSCVLLYFIGRRLYSRGIGLLGAAMLAVATVYINRVALPENYGEFFLLLTVFCYLQIRERASLGWGIALGASMGLGLLSSLGTVSAVLFVVLQSVLDGKLRRVWVSAVPLGALCLVYLLIAQHIGWHYFIADTWFASRGGFPDMVGLLQLLLLGRPDSQLAWAQTLQFNLWSTIGFVSCFYIAAKRDRGNNVLLVGLFAVLVTWVVVGKEFWWAHLAFFYPFYCLALAILFGDVARGRHASWFTGALVLLLALPLFGSGSLYPNLTMDFGRALFVFTYLFFLIVLVVARFRASGSTPADRYLRLEKASRVLLTVGLAAIVISNSAQDVRRMASDEMIDQRATADYLNTHVNNGDLVAAAPPIVYLLRPRTGIIYQDVAFYTTHIESYGWNLDTWLPRYKVDVSLDRMKYFVLDSPFYSLREWSQALGPRITSTWKLVASFGDYTIYENRQYGLLTTALQIDNERSWMCEAAPGDTLSVARDASQSVAGGDSMAISLDVRANNAFYYVDPPADWSTFSAMSFEWYGDRVGLVSVDILAPDWTSYYHYAFNDNWIGWRQVFVDLEQASISGQPAWTNISRIAFKFQTLPASGVVRVGDFEIYSVVK